MIFSLIILMSIFLHRLCVNRFVSPLVIIVSSFGNLHVLSLNAAGIFPGQLTSN